MESNLSTVDDLAEALALAPLMERYAEDALREFRDDPVPAGVAEAFLRRSFGAPQTLVLVAEDPGGGEPRGLCVVGPFEDPLTAEILPMVVLLHVQPEVRHRGLATALVREARRVLGARGLPALAARAGHNDDARISMGERWGFVRTWELMVRE